MALLSIIQLIFRHYLIFYSFLWFSIILFCFLSCSFVFYPVLFLSFSLVSIIFFKFSSYFQGSLFYTLPWFSTLVPKTYFLVAAWELTILVAAWEFTFLCCHFGLSFSLLPLSMFLPQYFLLASRRSSLLCCPVPARPFLVLAAAATS